jgi:hypothetical protein
MFKVFLLHLRISNNRGVVCRGLVEDYKVIIEFYLAIDDIRFEMEVSRGGVIFVESSHINIVAMLSDVVKELVYSSHIVRKDSAIAFAIITFSAFY